MKINYTKIETQLKNVFNAFLNSGMGRTVTYKKSVSSIYDPSTGINTDTYSYYEITAIRSDTALEAQGASTVLSAIGFKAGKMIYMIKNDDFPRTDTEDKNILKDVIVDNEIEYQVKKAVPIQGVFVRLQV